MKDFFAGKCNWISNFFGEKLLQTAAAMVRHLVKARDNIPRVRRRRLKIGTYTRRTANRCSLTRHRLTRNTIRAVHWIKTTLTLRLIIHLKRLVWEADKFADAEIVGNSIMVLYFA